MRCNPESVKDVYHEFKNNLNNLPESEIKVLIMDYLSEINLI